MSITNTQKQLVTESFAKVAPIAEQAAELFYNRLWEIAPETRAMFKSTDMKSQGIKLMQTLGIAVKSLYNLENLIPIVQELGKRHISYGVKKEHYHIVGLALLWTLGQGLGDDFTPEVEEAWASVYGVLASVATRAYEPETLDKSA